MVIENSSTTLIEACRGIGEYIRGISYKDFLENVEKQDAVIRNIKIIGEAVKHLSLEIKARYDDKEIRYPSKTGQEIRYKMKNWGSKVLGETR